MSKLLFNELKLKPKISKTSKKTNFMSTSEKVLESLKEEHPLPQILLNFRGIQKYLSNWTFSLIEKQVSLFEKNRICTIWSQTGTATGRLASSDPNLQNLPKNELNVFLEQDVKHFFYFYFSFLFLIFYFYFLIQFIFYIDLFLLFILFER